MKAFNSFLFVASFLIASALVIGLVGCSRQEKKEPPPTAQQPAPPLKPRPATTGPVSVDFDKAPLSDVALFVSSVTGKGFVFASGAEHPVTWVEFNIPREKFFDSFSRTLSGSGLLLKTSDEGRTYTIEKAEDVKVPCKLDFASSSRGTFFLLGSVVYPKEQFPFPAHQSNGHWYATVPKSFLDSLKQ